jgi:hypothetical protein
MAPRALRISAVGFLILMYRHIPRKGLSLRVLASMDGFSGPYQFFGQWVCRLFTFRGCRGRHFVRSPVDRSWRSNRRHGKARFLSRALRRQARNFAHLKTRPLQTLAHYTRHAPTG